MGRHGACRDGACGKVIYFLLGFDFFFFLF